MFFKKFTKQSRGYDAAYIGPADVMESDAAFPAGIIPDSLCQGICKTGTARQGLPLRFLAWLYRIAAGYERNWEPSGISLPGMHDVLEWVGYVFAESVTYPVAAS